MNLEDFIILFGVCFIGGLFSGGVLMLSLAEEHWGALVDKQDEEIKHLKAMLRKGN